VFLAHEAWRNVIIHPEARPLDRDRLLALIPKWERHKWFRSMNSSQALAQSIFGNLALYGHLDCLTALQSDESDPLLSDAHVSSDSFVMEHKVNHLREPRATSLDGYFFGDYQVAIECKFTEAEIGACSRPRLRPSASNYARDFCNGNYQRQGTRMTRCSLTERGVVYWQYVPHLFRWQNDLDLAPCPLNANYQLVRNILAIGARADETASLDRGHVVLIYDERNPVFQEGGNGLAVYRKTQEALIEPTMLRKCSWQRIVQHMRQIRLLPWLTEALAVKYGL
jgi:hypothetical protein